MRKVFNVLSSAVGLSVRLASYVAIIAVVAYMVPQLHKTYLRKVVGTKVVLVTTEDPKKVKTGYYGGTGFYVKAASGKTYIVTNRHVCRDASAKKEWMYVSSKGDSVSHKVKIIERYTSADLCLLEAPSGMKGLSLGEMPEVSQHVAAIGHPNLQPKTFTEGEVVGFEQWAIPLGIIGQGVKASDCKFKDNYVWMAPVQQKKALYEKYKYIRPTPSQEAANPAQAKIPVCMAKNFIMITTVLIYHGSSGSPVVDFFGRVVGVMYAVNQDQMWGRAMTVADLKALLSKY